MLRRVAVGIFGSLLLALMGFMLRASTASAESGPGPSVLTAYFASGLTSGTPSPATTPSPAATTPATSNVPKPTDWLQAGAAVVTALSIVIGGTLAYRRLLHTRPFTPLARLELNGKLVKCANKPALHVGITVKNAGSTQLLLDVGYEPLLRVVTAAPLAWSEAQTGNNGRPREVQWDGSSICDIKWLAEFGSGAAVKDLNAGALNRIPLPPAAELHKEFLIPVSGNAHAYLLLLTVIACQHIGPGRWFRDWQHETRCTKADKGQRRRRVFWTRSIVWGSSSLGG